MCVSRRDVCVYLVEINNDALAAHHRRPLRPIADHIAAGAE